MEKIKITYNPGIPGLCTNDCPYEMTHWGTVITVGSSACDSCEHNGETEDDYVNCNYEKEKKWIKK